MADKIVRLILTDAEYDSVLEKAINNGFANIPDYVRSLLFKESQSENQYEDLLTKFSDEVLSKKNLSRFRVRDMFDKKYWEGIPIEVRRGLGRIIYYKVTKSGWLPIVPDGKDTANAQWYRY